MVKNTGTISNATGRTFSGKIQIIERCIPNCLTNDHFEGDNDYVTQLRCLFIKGLDTFVGQFHRLPQGFTKILKNKIKEHVTVSVSWVRLHSKIQPGLPFIKMKERIIDRKKSGSCCAKSRAMAITNSKAI